MRKTAGYSWTEYKTKKETAKEVNITSSFGQNREEIGCNI
jgi:hypothetical protein